MDQRPTLIAHCGFHKTGLAAGSPTREFPCYHGTMMILRTAGPSPYGRKVRLAAAILKLEDRITIQAADAMDASDNLRQQNPLGKIPVLVTDDGTALYDSPVILEYLDHQAGGGRILPAEPKARFAALRLQALCDGLLDAALLRVYEGRWRDPDRREEKWLTYQADKMTRCLDVLEMSPPVVGDTPDVGHITLACALGYLDLRFERQWRADYPGLVRWLDAFAQSVPAFEQTKVNA